MTQAMYTAVSGIQANQSRLNVISNNIANVNTLGFKGSQANFATVFANTISGGTTPNGLLGGTNPRQVGNGTYVSEIASNWGQGGTQFTGRSTDLMINGDGFFAVERVDVNNGNSSTDFFLTRAGNFTLDAGGNLVTSTGNRVRGTSQVSGSTPATLGRINIPLKFLVTKDLDAAGEVLGTHMSPIGTTAATIAAGQTAGAASQNTVEVQLQSYSIGVDGSISAKYSNGDIITVRTNPVSAQAAATSGDPSLIRRELIHQTYEGGIYASTYTNAGANAPLYANDAGSMNQLGATPVFDGGTGSTSMTAGLEGMQFQIQMASVTNPAGLIYDGNNNYLQAANSGPAQFGVGGTGSRGSLNAGALESSNVDLAGEFTNMVVTQRGLEAASKVVRTQSEVLQTIIQMV